MTEEIVSNQSVAVTQVVPFTNKVDQALEAESTSVETSLEKKPTPLKKAVTHRRQ